MKTIIIVNDIPLREYQMELNELLLKIDYKTFTLPVTRFVILREGMTDSGWQEYTMALNENDYDYYVITVTLNDLNDEDELAQLAKYTNQDNVFSLYSSALKQSLKNKSIVDFIYAPEVKKK